jgi:FkbM family methyltransferase
MYKTAENCQIGSLNEIYTKYFGYPSNGYFVEVGAYDGESFSNTSCLADHGWSGLYIEPIHEYYLSCIDRHKNNHVTTVNFAIGLEEGEKEIIQYGVLSTLNEKHYKVFESLGWVYDPWSNRKTCKVVRLDNLMEQNHVPKEFDVLVVDVEGGESDVFKSFDLEIWKPKMMIVEISDEHEQFQMFDDYISEMKELTNYILDHEYESVYKDHINTVFVRKELKKDH